MMNPNGQQGLDDRLQFRGQDEFKWVELMDERRRGRETTC